MFRTVTNEKIGNLIVYLAGKIPDLGVTKLMKLLFLIDEKAVEETGTPVTWLSYEAWQMGPVPSELYEQISNGNRVFEHGIEQKLDDFISVEPARFKDHGGLLIKSKQGFCDDEFNDFEMELIDRIIADHGRKTASQLVEFTHSKGSKWDTTVERENLSRLFESGVKKSGIVVNLHPEDFSDLHLQAYSSAHESLQIREHFIISKQGK